MRENNWRPSSQMMGVIEGRVNHNDAPVAIQSALRLHYYHTAVEILGLPREERKKSLTFLPDTYRSQVEQETIRLWRLRK